MFTNYLQTLFILIGIQASGKTTFSQQFLQGKKHISLDVLHTRSKEWGEFVSTLQTGESCVIDNTNPTAQDRGKYIHFAKSKGYNVVGLYFSSVVEECSLRNEKRTGKAKVPFKAILSTAKRLEKPTYTEGFNELYYVKQTLDTFVVSKWNETL